MVLSREEKEKMVLELYYAKGYTANKRAQDVP
jgi:hypothetical protein